ncbi:hypothetical protein [uncultured Brevundimonas sp.]|uniref:nSTAND3 domain-containing NTPase n=1 Tax=uncultured Brevundimonas sp. TaxID=213418 RepID=UPI0025E2778E|nr:hypothetical protein [uncultured Brevundimonas sp.]
MLPSAHRLALEDLGWASFQDLAMAFAEDLLDAPVTSYARSWDGGVDGEQIVFGPALDTHQLRWAIQAKHTGQGGSLSAADLKTEYAKLVELVAEGFDAYLLITNHSVTRQAYRTIRERVLAAGFKICRIQGRHQLVRRIRSSPRLRMLAPRVYGIGDLSLILDERLAEQTTALLTRAKGDLDRFVATEAYRRTMRALHDEGFVILLGEPAAGKSTIAMAASIAARDAFRAQPYVLHRLSDLQAHWNPSEPRLFWIDDAFGATQLELGSAETFNRMLRTIEAAVSAGNRFVLTSRAYIWNAVSPRLKLSGSPQFEKGIVEVRVEDFTDRDKALILANHIRLGDHDRMWRRRFIPLAPRVVRHPRFTPEVARRFGLSIFTGDLDLVDHRIDAYVENPGSYLEELVTGLSEAGQAALALLFMKGGSLPLLPAMDDAFSAVTEAFGTTRSDVLRELEAMDGSLCRRQSQDGELFWHFRHPSIGEAFASVAVRSPLLLDVYLRGAPPERILQEAVCAGVDVRGAVVEISVAQYDQLIARIEAYDWGGNQSYVRWFLITRATAEFRRRFFSSTPLSVDHPVLAGGRQRDHLTLGLIAALAPLGLVKTDFLETIRRQIRRGLTEQAERDYLSSYAREIIGGDSFAELLDTVVWEMREGGESFISYFQTRDAGRPARERFEPLASFVSELEDWVATEDASSAFKIVRERIADRISELEDEADRDEWDWLAEDYYYRLSADPPVSTRLPHREQPLVPPQGPIRTDPIADIFSDLDQ